MIRVNREPSGRDVRVFALLWLLFFGVVGALAWKRPDGLVGAATFLGAAWLVSLVFNSVDRRGQLLGALLPGLLGTAGGAVKLGAPGLRVALAVWAVGLAGALVAAGSHAAGKRLYVTWMLAAVPVGWTISNLVLGLAYYAVLTPIGVAMRLGGKDPMSRKFDPDMKSYWIERPRTTEPARYFRQF